MTILIAISAFILDCIIGDPKSKFHPVALLGTLIAHLEKLLLGENHAPLRKIFSGGVLVALVLPIVYGASSWALQVASSYDLWLWYVLSALMLSFTITPRSLAEAGYEIRGLLLRGDLANARLKVGWIVGRDTKRLDGREVARATVETIAENIVDGIISPLFYFFLGGVPLAVLYRAVNTMDSMVGYRNARYLCFGKVAARTDDVFNYIPARITAVLLVLAAFLLRLDGKNAARMIWRDARKHPSPNSGFSEAGVAGALGVRLGGLNYYFGVPSIRAYMGDPLAPLAPRHIVQTIFLMYAATVLFIAGAIAVSYIGGLLT